MKARSPKAFPFDPTQCAAPLPRAYQWADGSAYVVHVELVRKARGADMPPSFWTDPLIYQGGSDIFLGPTDPIPGRRRSPGASISKPRSRSSPTTCRWGSTAEDARQPHQARDARQRRVAAATSSPPSSPRASASSSGKPWTSFSPVAVTPDELGDAWNGGSIDLPLITTLNGERLRQAQCPHRHGVRLSAADRARRQDAAAGRGNDHRLGHGRERGSERRLVLHRRAPRHRDDRTKARRRRRS